MWNVVIGNIIICIQNNNYSINLHLSKSKLEYLCEKHMKCILKGEKYIIIILEIGTMNSGSTLAI